LRLLFIFEDPVRNNCNPEFNLKVHPLCFGVKVLIVLEFPASTIA
jgi:hypothetical protein